MVTPVSFSSWATYSLNTSSDRPRLSVSTRRLASSAAASSLGTTTSVTRNTICSIGCVLGGAEHGIDGGRRQRARALAAFEAARALDLEIVGGGDLGKRRAGLEPPQHLGRPGGEAGRPA